TPRCTGPSGWAATASNGRTTRSRRSRRAGPATAMHAANDSIDRADPASATAPAPLATPQVRTLLLTDLCDSTSLVEKLGDNAAAELFRAHDRLVLELQQRWHGRLIDRSDGLLLLFERAIDGLGFALDYARGLR